MSNSKEKALYKKAVIDAYDPYNVEHVLREIAFEKGITYEALKKWLAENVKPFVAIDLKTGEAFKLEG